MTKLRWMVLFVLTFLVITPLSSASAQETGLTIYGVIDNGTPGGSVPESQPVSLFVYTDGALSGQYDTTADSSGMFTIVDIDLSNGDEVVAFTNYAGAVYSSVSFVYGPEISLPSLSIAIYESTEDSSDVTISQLTFMLNASDGELRVGEYYLINNAGNRTWIGSTNIDLGFKTTMAFSLPSAAESLWFSGYGLDVRFFTVEGGFVDSAPVVPGVPSAEIFFSYALPFDGSYALTKTLNLPVENVEYLIAEGSQITLEGEGITYNDTIETDTGAALSYISAEFDANQTLTFQVVEQSTTAMGSFNGLEIGIGLAVLVIAGLGIFFMMKRGKNAVLPASAGPLLHEIANLDDAYAAGELKLAQYHKARRDLIERVKKLR